MDSNNVQGCSSIYTKSNKTLLEHGKIQDFFFFFLGVTSILYIAIKFWIYGGKFPFFSSDWVAADINPINMPQNFSFIRISPEHFHLLRQTL